jgi:DNA polymerase-3 subunit gamma/tau
VIQGGVAIEQFVIDLAGYFRSLLLAKTGITRESLLGYRPDRFSAKVLDALNAPRLEHALELLLGLYRDIRYSVSPRFELETVIAKLCLLTRWVSPEDRAAAVPAARAALGGQAPQTQLGGLGGGASPGGAPPAEGRSEGGDWVTTPLPHGSAESPTSGGDGEIDLSAPGALREQFKRLTAHQSQNEAADPVDVVKTVFNGTVV